MIRNIVFDYGQVLVRFEPRKIAAHYVDPADLDLIEQVVFDRSYWDRQDAGTINDEEMIAAACVRLPERLHAAAREITKTWFYHLPPITETEDLVKDLKSRGLNLYLLSNIGMTFIRHKEEFPIFSLFDGCVFSAATGYAKPQKEIYEYLFDRWLIRPEESLFVDDRPKNIATAKNLGMDAFLFEGDVGKLREYLNLRIKG